MQKYIASLLMVGLAVSPAQGQVPEEQADYAAEQTIAAPLSEHATAVVEGLNSFSLDMYLATRDPAKNHFISPASISTAFGLAYGGAEGQTKQEIAKVLRYPLDRDAFEPAMGELLSTMQIDAKGRRMTVNNALWLQEGLPVRQDWIDRMDRHYGAGVKWVDYASNPNAARIQINDWVASKTNDRIKDLLAEPHVAEDTKSVLVNTIFFKADWGAPFSEAATKIEPFSLQDGAKVETKLMNLAGYFQTVQSNNVQAIRLPYRGGETEMTIFLPKSPRKLDAFEQSLTGEKLEGLLEELDNSEHRDVILTLPQFQLKWKKDVVPALMNLGMAVALTDDADFSGMKTIDNNSSDTNDWAIKIDAVIHQTFLDVEEKGTEAAAATAITSIVVTGASSGPPPPPPVIFRADRPFMFLIRDRRTGAIIFMGRYVSPDPISGD